MSITKLENGKYFLNFRPEGIRGPQIKRIFETKQAALLFQKKRLGSAFVPEMSDYRTFEDLLQLWYDSHGVSLKTSVDTRNRLLAMAKLFPQKPANKLSSFDFVNYRSNRLSSGIKPATLNRELATLNSLFNELFRLGHIAYSNPFSTIRRLKEKKVELSYLTHQQIELLYKQVLASKNASLYYVVQLCLSTGARWSEVEGITYASLKNNGVEFLDTKNGHNRFVPLAEHINIELKSYLKINSSFDSCYSAFRSALERTGIKTPSGQSAHILRHTFASHFIMNGGNILTLQKILGHSSLQVTTRYAHLAPDFLLEAVKYNPLEYDKN